MSETETESLKAFTTRFPAETMARLHGYIMRRQNETSRRFSYSSALRELVEQLSEKEIDLPSYKAWLKAWLKASKK